MGKEKKTPLNKKGGLDVAIGPKHLIYLIIIIAFFLILWAIISSMKKLILT
jgi:hypothetical protein